MPAAEMDKAVILARGLGTRMRRPDAAAALDSRQTAVAETGVKAMVPLDRPFLDYVLSALADAGYRRVCLVVAPDHQMLSDYYVKRSPPRRVRMEFAVQAEPRGTADAVAAAGQFAGADPVLVVNSDDYYPIEALRELRRQAGPATALFEQDSMFSGSNIPPERIRQFAVGLFGPEGVLRRILEKPDAAALAALPRPLWVSMNCFRFGPSIFEACRQIRPSPRGELEITDAVQYAIDVLGETFRVVQVRAPVLDITSRGDIATVAAKLAGLEIDP
jgi:glucose-1-phosphate thymidylyltransferase